MEIKITQPLWYHPTRVLLVDDDKKVLKSLGKQIDRCFPFLAYTNPEKALECLKKHTLPLKKLSEEIISDIDPSEAKHLCTENVAVDFSPLHTSLDKPGRFDEFVTVVVDKVMEEMDGLDFCRAVRRSGLPVKLILLTGNVGANEAVAAFNDHIIDAFIEKTDVNMIEQINHQLHTLAFQAFCDSSTKLLGLILNKFPLLNNKKFADFLKKVCQENNVAEYYLLDSSCSYLLVTGDGQKKILLIKSANDFKNAYDLAVNDKANNMQLLEALEKKKAFPFTRTQSYFTFDVDKWQDVMVATKKQEDLDFYYAIADLPEKASSFNHYVSEIWQPKIE